MKRVVVVAVGIGLLFGIATTVNATVTGGKHDFTALGAHTACNTCHAAHKPKLNVPLWKHALTVATYDLYNINTDYKGGNSLAYDPSPASLTGMSSRLCMSCHDGTLAVLGTTYTDPLKTILWDNGAAAPVAVGYSTGLRGSHPVGVNYETVQTVKPLEYLPASTLPGGNVKLENSKVGCTSCHDPHITASKLLRTSGVCLKCHVK